MCDINTNKTCFYITCTNIVQWISFLILAKNNLSSFAFCLCSTDMSFSESLKLITSICWSLDCWHFENKLDFLGGEGLRRSMISFLSILETTSLLVFWINPVCSMSCDRGNKSVVFRSASAISVVILDILPQESEALKLASSLKLISSNKFWSFRSSSATDELVSFFFGFLFWIFCFFRWAFLSSNSKIFSRQAL